MKSQAQWLNESLFVAEFRVTNTDQRKTIRDFADNMAFTVTVIRIIRDWKVLNMPTGEDEVEPGDILHLMGTRDEVDACTMLLEEYNCIEYTDKEDIRLKEYIYGQSFYDVPSEDQLTCLPLKVDGKMDFVKKSIKNSNIRPRYKATIIGIERGDLPIINPDIETEDDIVWICDKCGQMLNIQDGFADNGGKWTCTNCGTVNMIDGKNLYDTEEAYTADLHNPYRGLTDEEALEISSYREVNPVGGRPNVILVEEPDTGKLYIKKYLTVYDKSIYEYLKDHPVDHMPRILFLAEGSNCLVVIEDYIEGQTVGDLIVSKQLTKRRSVDIICQILRILLHLHGLPDPIIHRDIKPSNLIVDPKGEVYLLDMNAAKWYEPDLIDDGNYLGTRYFAAPEQVGYGLKASSAKSDIYAVGILLNVMLTGALPKEKPAEGAFRDIIEKCTKLEADQRYSAEELLRELEKVQNGGEGNG